MFKLERAPDRWKDVRKIFLTSEVILLSWKEIFKIPKKSFSFRTIYFRLKGKYQAIDPDKWLPTFINTPSAFQTSAKIFSSKDWFGLSIFQSIHFYIFNCFWCFPTLVIFQSQFFVYPNWVILAQKQLICWENWGILEF